MSAGRAPHARLLPGMLQPGANEVVLLFGLSGAADIRRDAPDLSALGMGLAMGLPSELTLFEPRGIGALSLTCNQDSS